MRELGEDGNAIGCRRNEAHVHAADKSFFEITKNPKRVAKKFIKNSKII